MPQCRECYRPYNGPENPRRLYPQCDQSERALPRKVQIDVDDDVLADMLDLPDGVRVTAVTREEKTRFRFLLEGPGLSKRYEHRYEHYTIQTATPRYHSRTVPIMRQADITGEI